MNRLRSADMTAALRRYPDGSLVVMTSHGFEYHVDLDHPDLGELLSMYPLADLPIEVAPDPGALSPEQRLAAMPPVSHAQMIGALIGAGIITEAEGIAWITGTLPDAVEAMIAVLPAEQRVMARLRAIRPSSVVPTDPLVAALAAAQGKSTTDLIDLFETAAAL